MVSVPVSVNVPESLPHTTCSMALIEYVPRNLSARLSVNASPSLEQDEMVRAKKAITHLNIDGCHRNDYCGYIHLFSGVLTIGSFFMDKNIFQLIC